MAQPELESTEAELIKRVCGGEPQAFEELLRPYERLVYATAISILRNPADAEEVAQEAVLKAFSKLSSFRGESRFSTWLVQITYNEARMKLRKERQHLYESIDREQQDQEGEYWPRDFADWRPIPSELLEKERASRGLAEWNQFSRPDVSGDRNLKGCPEFESQGHGGSSWNSGRKRENATSSREVAIERLSSARHRWWLELGAELPESQGLVKREGCYEHR